MNAQRCRDPYPQAYYETLIGNAQVMESEDPVVGRWDWHREILVQEILKLAAYSHKELSIMIGDNDVLPLTNKAIDVLSKYSSNQIRMIIVNAENESKWQNALEYYQPESLIQKLQLPSNSRETHMIVCGNASLMSEWQFSGSEKGMHERLREISTVARFNDEKQAKALQEEFDQWWQLLTN